MDILAKMLIDTLTIGVLMLQLWALVDAAIRPTPAYVAAGKLTKPAWLVITGASALTGFLPLLSMFRLAGVVASIVYLVDVRPEVRKASRGGSRW